MNSLLDNFLKYNSGDPSSDSGNNTLTWTLKNVSRSGNSKNAFTKISGEPFGLNNQWDAMACTKESYKTGYFTARPGTLNKYCVFGLTEKSVNPTLNDISYGWVLTQDNQIYTNTIVNGKDTQTPVNNTTTYYTTSTVLSATYDETSVNFFMNGTKIRTVQRTNTNSLHFAMVFFHKDASVKDVGFGSSIQNSLKFLNDGTNLIDRDKYETDYSNLERSTNIEEETLNEENSNFKGADVKRKIKIQKIDKELLEIETLEYNKERLKKYVVDGASAYKFEINKVWVYTIFNVGGCAAMIYMFL